MYLDVDCSKFTYDTLPSVTIQVAVEKAQREMNEMPLTVEGVMLNRTETQEEVLSKSLLKHIDEKEASEDDILEAYCRDVDAYSFEFNQVLDPERPPNCDPIPHLACAVVYDEKYCLSGWNLTIPEAEIRFEWISQYYPYR